MNRLVDASERLDGPLEDRAALIGNLRDLARVNRRLGGVELSARAIELLTSDRDHLSLLDVGTGGADIPLELIHRWTARGRRLRVVGIDSRPEILAAAATADRRITALDGLELHVADGRALPYPDGTFDIVHTSLVIHHLAPDAASTLLGEKGRVARIGVVVYDLARGRLAYAGAWLLAHAFTRNAFTRHDAPTSVRRAYTVDELSALIAAAGSTEVGRIRGPFGHRWAIAAAPPPVVGSER